MINIKNVGVLAGLLFAFACGGEAYEDESAEFDAIEQEVTSGVRASVPSNLPGYGVADGTTRPSCTNSSNTQLCYVPHTSPARQLDWCFGVGALTDAQRAVVRNAVTSIDGASQWNYTEVPNASCKHFFVVGAAGGGTSSTAISAYRTWTPSALSNLTESVPGTWKSFASSTCVIDINDITAKGTTQTQDDHLLRHAAGSCLEHMRGLGTISGTGEGYRSSSVDFAALMVPDFFVGTCLANAFNQSSPTTFAFNNTLCN